jgi:hypothetical protein
MRQPLRERHSARSDTRERKFLDPAIALDNLVRNPRQRARHALAVYDNGHDDLRLKLQQVRLIRLMGERRKTRIRGGRCGRTSGQA